MRSRVVTFAALTVAISASSCASDTRIPTAAFAFDNVTYELPPGETRRIGGPLRDSDADVIRSTALAELRHAYSGVSLVFAESHHEGRYRVLVLQELGGQLSRREALAAPAGESRTLGPFGGRGTISFLVLATSAVHYAPPGATRAEIVSGIGRGIGRAAAHEFAHQIVPELDLHQVQDRESYEYGNADRAAQYYGTLHWTTARTPMARKLGGRWWGLPIPPA